MTPGRTPRVLALVVAWLALGQAQAQDWDRRHAFAKSYYGLSLIGAPAMAEGLLVDEDVVMPFGRSAFLSPAVNIGATHFWGHADFYVSINTVPIKLGDDAVKNSIHMGTFTGLRVYPWAVGEGQGVKPYLGYKFSPWRYRQGDTPELSYKTTRIKGMVDAGLGLATSWGYFTLEGTKLLNPDFEVNLTTTGGPTPDRWPGWTVGMGLNISLETTSVASNPVNKQLNQELREHNKQGLFLAAGPSSAFPVVGSEGAADAYPYLDDLSFPTIFPDVALGYHFTKADALVAVSRRRMVQRRSAYNRALNIDRQSTALEAYKFVGDYHGFVPYVGLGVGMERMDLEEREGDVVVSEGTYVDMPWYLVFGWDIRPSERGDWWVLRTNLRIPPMLELDHDDHTWSLQHLEFNFIQLVVYPQRWKRAKDLAKAG